MMGLSLMLASRPIHSRCLAYNLHRLGYRPQADRDRRQEHRFLDDNRRMFRQSNRQTDLYRNRRWLNTKLDHLRLKKIIRKKQIFQKNKQKINKTDLCTDNHRLQI